MSTAKSPGAVAAHGAFEIDQLGGTVVSKNSAHRNFTQAPSAHQERGSGARHRRKGDRARAAALMRRQFDLFIAEPETPLIGLRLKLDRPVDRDRPCCRNICSIGPGKGPHAGELSCAECGRHRGWVSKATAQWIESVISRFGAPTTPIVVRRSHTYEEEAPPQTNR